MFAISFLATPAMASVFATSCRALARLPHVMCEVLIHLPQVGPVNRSHPCDSRSRLIFRDGRPCGDCYEHRHHKNRREDKSELMRFRCHVPPLGPDSEFGCTGWTGEKSVMPVTLWSNRRKL